MTPGWAPIVLSSITGAMLALPLTPALVELVRRRDAGPLETRRDDGKIRNFADAFRRYIASARPALAGCERRNCIEEVRLRDGQYALAFGVAGHCDEIDSNFPNTVLFSRPVWFRDQQVFTKDLYAADALHSGKRNVFRAILGEKDIFLAEQTQVLRWIHAEGSVIAETGCTMFGRLSAGESISLSEACRFERAYATTIFAVAAAGAQTSVAIPDQVAPDIDPELLLPPKTANKLGRSRIDGDLHLRLGEMFLGNIIATGSIHVEKDTQIVGSAKAHGEVHLHDRVRVQGAIVGAGCVHTGSDCYIQGPLLAEREIHLGPGTRVGTSKSPTTVSAPRIYLAPGCVVHGSLWAKIEGQVEA